MGKKINTIALGVLGVLCVWAIACFILYLHYPIYVLSLLSYPAVSSVLQAIGSIEVVLLFLVVINFFTQSVGKNEYIKKKPVKVVLKSVEFPKTPFDKDLISAMYYVNDRYFSKQYPKENLNPPRPNHNILHALRTAAYVPDVVAYYQAFGENKERFLRFERNDIINLQLLMLFNSTGRECEAASRLKPQYRKASGDAFEQYCLDKKPVFIDEKMRENLKDHLVRRGDPRFTDPIDIILNTAHNLDLLRCYRREQYVTSTIDYITAHSEKGINALRQEAFDRLLLKAQVLNRASGQPMSIELYLSPCGAPLYFDSSVSSDGKVFQSYSENPLSFIKEYLLKNFAESVSIKCFTEEEEREQLFNQGQLYALNRMDPIDDKVRLRNGPLVKTTSTNKLQKYIETLCVSVTTNPEIMVDLGELIRKANWSHIILGKKEADHVSAWMHGLQGSARDGLFTEPFNGEDDKRFDKEKGLSLIYGLKEVLLSAYAYVGCESDSTVSKKQGYNDNDLGTDGCDIEQIKDDENILAEVIEKYSVEELDYMLKLPKLNKNMMREMLGILMQLEVIAEDGFKSNPEKTKRATEIRQCFLDLAAKIRSIRDACKSNPAKTKSAVPLVLKDVRGLLNQGYIHEEIESIKCNTDQLCTYYAEIKEHDSNKERNIELILKMLIGSRFEISEKFVRNFFNAVSSKIADFCAKSFVERKRGYSLEESILKISLDFYTALLNPGDSKKTKYEAEKVFENMRGYLLSDVEKEAIHIYTDDAGYRCINSVLRGDVMGLLEKCPDKKVTEQQFICYWFLVASFCASGLNKAPKISNQYSYRMEYLSDEDTNFLKVLQDRCNAFSGKRPLYQSGCTSSSLNYPMNRCGNCRTLFNNCRPVDASRLSDKENEREVILPAGSHLLFTALKKNNSSWFFRAEQVCSPETMG